MHGPRLASQVVLLILDGLRPDAITPRTMPALAALQARGWSATGLTVRPSVTVAALGSLATGVGPAGHGLHDGNRWPSLGVLRRARTLPQVLRAHGRRTAVIAARLPAASTLLAGALLRMAGISRFASAGRRPAEVATAALARLGRGAPDLGVVYVNDCDVAGHRAGWMSGAYLEAARAVDDGVAVLAPLAERDGTVLLVVADHGGGGASPTDHDAPHPLNDRIPLVAAGPAVTPGSEPDRAPSLLDVPPTVAHALGVPVPASWEGRALPILAGRRAIAA